MSEQEWDDLDPVIRKSIAVLEAFEDVPSNTTDPPLDDFGYVMDLFLDPLYREEPVSEAIVAMWLVAGRVRLEVIF